MVTPRALTAKREIFVAELEERVGSANFGRVRDVTTMLMDRLDTKYDLKIGCYVIGSTTYCLEDYEKCCQKVTTDTDVFYNDIDVIASGALPTDFVDNVLSNLKFPGLRSIEKLSILEPQGRRGSLYVPYGRPNTKLLFEKGLPIHLIMGEKPYVDLIQRERLINAPFCELYPQGK